MDVDQFARMLVAIERSGELPGVLAHVRLSEDDWAAERGRWRTALANDPDQRIAFRRAFEDAKAGRVAIPTKETATAPATETHDTAAGISVASNENHAAEAPVAVPLLDPDETAMVPSPLYVKPALPFAGETSPERLAEIAGPAPDTQRAPKEPKPGFDPDETAMLPSPLAASPAPSTGSFRDQLGAVVVPILSLEEYAELRAELSVHGEEHPGTLKRFGIASAAAHAALKARFAEYFKREPDALQRFVHALQIRTSAARARSPQ